MKAFKVFILRYKIGIIVPILLISIFLRFYKVQDLFVFTGDEEHQLSIAQTIVKNFHIEWVGVATTLLVYITGRIIFGSVTATMSSFLYATLPLIIYYDRKFWNPALTSFTSLI